MYISTLVEAELVLLSCSFEESFLPVCNVSCKYKKDASLHVGGSWLLFWEVVLYLAFSLSASVWVVPLLDFVQWKIKPSFEFLLQNHCLASLLVHFRDLLHCRRWLLFLLWRSKVKKVHSDIPYFCQNRSTLSAFQCALCAPKGSLLLSNV